MPHSRISITSQLHSTCHDAPSTPAAELVQQMVYRLPDTASLWLPLTESCNIALLRAAIPLIDDSQLPVLDCVVPPYS